MSPPTSASKAQLERFELAVANIEARPGKRTKLDWLEFDAVRAQADDLRALVGCRIRHLGQDGRALWMSGGGDINDTELGWAIASGLEHGTQITHVPGKRAVSSRSTGSTLTNRPPRPRSGADHSDDVRPRVGLPVELA